MTDTTPAVRIVPERFYIDCEFDGHNGPLLSIALVREDGDSIHIRADVEPMDLWVRRNVLPLMDSHRAPKSANVYHDEVGGVIRSFIGESVAPVIVADSPVDIGRFCRALSTGPDGQWASADYPLMTFEVHNVNCYPTELEGAVQHNAWWDAMALRHALAAAPVAPGEGEAFDLPSADSVRRLKDLAEALRLFSEHGGKVINQRNAAILSKDLFAALRARSDPEAGRWYAAEDIDRMVREIDVAMNGDGAARQAKLCDIFKQVIERVSEPEAGAATETVRCQHEAYQGSCAHCGVKIVNGRAVSPSDPSATERMRAALSRAVHSYDGIPPQHRPSWIAEANAALGEA